MKVSKAWCGLFTAVGSGFAGVHFLADKVGSSVFAGVQEGIKSFVNATANLAHTPVTIRHPALPQPITATIDLQFALKQALGLNNTLIETLESLPGLLSAGVKAVIWEQGTVILLTVAAIGGVGIYAYNKFNPPTQGLQLFDEVKQGLVNNEHEPARRGARPSGV